MKYLNTVHHLLLQRLGIPIMSARTGFFSHTEFAPLSEVSWSPQFKIDLLLYLSEIDQDWQQPTNSQHMESIVQQLGLSPHLNYLDAANKRLLWQKLQMLDLEHS